MYKNVLIYIYKYINKERKKERKKKKKGSFVAPWR